MWQDAHDAYLESRIESADPIQLVRLLYQGATAAVREARSHLAAGEIAERSRAITKAHTILTELTLSLDHQRGGDLSTRLAQLYDYMLRRLLEANFRQIDEPLAEVLGLLATLGEAWDGIQEQNKPVEREESPWTQTPPEAPPSYASGGWSL
jgi:flagellar protein FliS